VIAMKDGLVTSTLSSIAGATPVTTRSAQRKAAIAALLTVIMWASSFVAIRILGESYSPGALASGRIGIAALVLAVVAYRYRRPLPTGRPLGLVIAYGVAWFGGYMVVLNQAEHYLDAGTAAMLVNLAPLLVAVFAGFLLGEGFSRWLMIGIGIAFAGTVMIATGGTGGGTVNTRFGVVLGLLAAVLYAAGVLMQKVVLRSIDVFTATFLGCATGAVVLLPFSVQFVQQSLTAPASAVAAVVYLGVFPTAIAFNLWAYALARTDAGRLTATTLTVPAIAIVLSWLLLGELPTMLGMAGGALCLLGVAISRRR
jgi:drug/metabolite transporter (DMT)-like permease